MRITTDRRPVIAALVGLLFFSSVAGIVVSYRTSSAAVATAVEKHELESASGLLRRTLLWNLSATTVVALIVLWFAMTTVRRQYRGLELVATTDGLTGIANRHAGEVHLAEAAVLATRKQQPLSALLLDLDRFKTINDAYGHPMGDRVLQSVARVASAAVRADDCVARWGGEEFLIVLPGCGIADARLLAERIRSRIESEHFAVGDLAPCTVSIGAVEWSPKESRDSLLVRVDDALYRAKELGRNRVELAAA